MSVLVVVLICLGGVVFFDGVWNFFVLLTTSAAEGSLYFPIELLAGLILFLFGLFLRKKFGVKIKAGYYLLGIFTGLILWQIAQYIYYMYFYKPY